MIGNVPNLPYLFNLFLNSIKVLVITFKVLIGSARKFLRRLPTLDYFEWLKVSGVSVQFSSTEFQFIAVKDQYWAVIILSTEKLLYFCFILFQFCCMFCCTYKLPCNIVLEN